MKSIVWNCCTAWLLICGWATVGRAQAPEDDPSPSDRLPLRPLLDEGRTIAQWFEEEPIETDRDSFTPATSTVAQGRVIVEAAYSFIDQRATKDTHSVPEFVARWGLTDWFELRFGAGYEVGGAGNDISTGGGGSAFDTPGVIEDEAQLLYGFKIGLTQQDGWKPRSSVILQGASPTSGPEATSQFIGAYVWGWQLANGWRWDSAIRLVTDEATADRHNLWAPSTVVKVPIGDRWAAHAEYFGIVTSGLADARGSHYFSPGLHYLVTNDLELGVRVGWGLSHDAANFFSNVGLGWRY